MKLNSHLRKVLAAVLPLNNQNDVLASVEAAGFDRHGLTAEQIAYGLDELCDLGLAVATLNDDGSDIHLHLTSDAASYFRDSKVEIAKTVGKYAFQLLMGASGGAVVFLLGSLLGQ